MGKITAENISRMVRRTIKKAVLFINSVLPASIRGSVPQAQNRGKSAPGRPLGPRPNGAPQQRRPVAGENRPQQSARVSQQNRPPRLDLPFVKRKQDAGSWIYQHRIAISITLICYLILSICFVTSKIVLNKYQTNSTIVVDFTDLEKLQEELERAQELNRLLNEQQQYDFDDVGNRISNEQGQENDNQLTRNSNMSDIFDRAEQVQGRVRANRERFEKGLREQQEMIDSRKKGNEQQEQKAETGKAKGKVTVSYSLNNPLRNAENLYIPAYRCEGGGEVVVKIAVDRNGDVVEATVDTSQSSTDYCMTTTAVEAALRSRFDVNMEAPARQYGTISYVFIPQ